MTVLQVAYSLAPVGDDAAGGAEQVLKTLDAGLVRRGHRSIVVAPAGSRCRGELVATPAESGPLDAAARDRAIRAHRDAITGVLATAPVDVVHLHGLDFPAYLPPDDPPVLVTLHLPPAWYPATALSPDRPQTRLVCVSRTQRRACPASARILGIVENGVDLDQLRPGGARGDHAVVLGRICPEKGIHDAVEACRRAELPLRIAGRVFGYPEHEQYFTDRVQPALDRERRLVGRVGGERKRRLVAGARCLLVPSRAAETSSLVAMEALACGTPVIAYRSGALPEIVDDGVTGLLVDGPAEMAEAIRAAAHLDRRTCRRAAEARFSAGAMVEGYLRIYRRCRGATGSP